MVSICQDHKGFLWLGTYGGVNLLLPDRDRFVHYGYDAKNASGLSDNKVLCIHEAHDGLLWIGTANGLNQWNGKTQHFRHFSEKDGLPDNAIHGILEDDRGYLWISTNKGICKFDPATLKTRNYNENEGLQSKEFGVNAYCRLKSGEMIFGGINGFNIFHPDSIKNNLDIPSVVLTDFQIFNKSVPVGKRPDGHRLLEKCITESEEIALSYRDNVFSFEFAALHYASPKNNLYAYMMEGFDREWNYIDADRRFASYTNLTGGNYTFRVKASNNDGIWNEEGVSLKITITPPFWKTLWFQVIGITALLFLLVIVYQIRTHTIRERTLQLERRVEDRTKELHNEINDRKWIEKTLRINEEKYSKLFEEARDGIILADADTGVILDCNRAAVELVGREKSELVG